MGAGFLPNVDGVSGYVPALAAAASASVKEGFKGIVQRHGEKFLNGAVSEASSAIGYGQGLVGKYIKSSIDILSAPNKPSEGQQVDAHR